MYEYHTRLFIHISTLSIQYSYNYLRSLSSQQTTQVHTHLYWCIHVLRSHTFTCVYTHMDLGDICYCIHIGVYIFHIAIYIYTHVQSLRSKRRRYTHVHWCINMLRTRTWIWVIHMLLNTHWCIHITYSHIYIYTCSVSSQQATQVRTCTLVHTYVT